MRRFEDYMRSFSDVAGWFPVPAAAIWDCLLDFQEASGVNGNLMEIGVWKGKSAGCAALHCRREEFCLFVDPLPLADARETISRLVPKARCKYLQETSQLLPRYPVLKETLGSFRWIHIDGEHSSEAVAGDLRLAADLVCSRGIVVVDDFFSPSYPQVTQSVFQFIAGRPAPLSLILCGFQKGYLCRPTAARTYLDYIRSSLHRDLTDRQCGAFTIWKTTEPADMNTFGVTDRFLEFDYRGPDWDQTGIYS